jgi:hypothetical protein
LVPFGVTSKLILISGNKKPNPKGAALKVGFLIQRTLNMNDRELSVGVLLVNYGIKLIFNPF